jgi:hypothetical protein
MKQFPHLGETCSHAGFVEGEAEMTMRTLLILAAIIGFSASAFAQTRAPKIGHLLRFSNGTQWYR